MAESTNRLGEIFFHLFTHLCEGFPGGARVGFEMGIDISPSSNVNLTYVSDPATSYVKSIDQQESKNLNAKLGFDLTTSKGFSMMSISSTFL